MEKNFSRNWSLFALILAGESIFFLPFVIPRVFRPTVLEVFGIDNFQLGTFFSVYGTIAILAYLLGGPIADRFAPSKLMSTALTLTALGGIFLSTIPDISHMPWLYGFWGISTILLFWAALFKTTRLIAGKAQGFAFGLLDGGRGLTSAIVSTLAAWVFAVLIGDQIEMITDLERKEAFQKVILFFSAFVFLAALLINRIIRSVDHLGFDMDQKIDLKHISKVARMPAVWLQAFIILCGYSGYKVSDDFSLLAQDVLGYDEVKAAGIGALSLWLRPIAAVGAGLLADKVSASRMILICFALMVFAAGSFGLGFFEGAVVIHVMFLIVSTSIAVFALRGLYFAIMEEAKIPLALTGTAVGIASIIGYLPDIFMGPTMGYLLDNSPGKLGHQHVFLFIAGIAALGFLITLVFRRVVR
ncbi:MAG: MFS transporter [Flavobacteriales bacterium]|nr:MFS transporter [Flavobacteriales bacterium]